MLLKVGRGKYNVARAEEGGRIADAGREGESPSQSELSDPTLPFEIKKRGES